MPTQIINSVVMGYRQYLNKNLIELMGDKLVLFKSVNMESKYITMIVTPPSLRG